ncbi:MAG: pyrroline-5-carboxylate reductase [Candidatus Omnitrophota bacterium]
MKLKRIAIIGCGNMGEAILNRLLGRVKRIAITVCEKDRKKRERIGAGRNVRVTGDVAVAVQRSDIVLLAVKPQDLDGVIDTAAGALSDSATVLSIAAGVTTGYIEKRFSGRKVPVVRAMPNMPAVVGEAITALCPGRYARAGHLALAQEILSAIGETVLVREQLIDAVTAISGSGPAYFFYLMESLIEAAVSMGLSKKNARRLVEKTAFGSAKVLQWCDESPADLRRRVTSKGGTTEAAFRVFEEKHFKSIVRSAVRQAAARSKELSK